jgi:hypothetical protein
MTTIPSKQMQTIIDNCLTKSNEMCDSIEERYNKVQGVQEVC